ncbi:hypothetical protein DFJ73DRAFT_162324 [Zopfochytrium polystomum]|nr:hypothetical protein DFJ73DRAFT_162324 [Zopfochytrium polystomum]
MKEPLELRPHFDRKPPVESDEAPTSVPKKEKEGVASDSSKKDLGGKKQPSSGPSKENTAPSSATTDRSEEALNKRTLHIANVPQQVDKSELEKLFHPFGEIRRIHIVQRPKEKRAFAFISFKTEESAAKAISSVKDGKHLGMTEPLKIEFSKADQLKDKDNTREKEKEKDTSGSGKADKAGGPSGKAGAKERPTDQPWKKGADLAKLLEKTATPATAPGTASTRSAAATSASSTASRKGSGGRTTIFIRDVPQNVTTEELKAKFNAVGPLRSFFIVDKLGPESGKCAVIAFEKGDDAARAVKEKIENALFPRQRRLTILGLPADVQEAPLKAHLAESGEVRRVELKPSEGNAAMGAEAEFARGDVAIVVFARLLSSGYKGQTVKVGYSPSSSGKAGVGADGNPVNGSDLKDDGNDSGDEADHEGERSDSRRGSEASVPGEHQTVSPAPQSSQTVLPPAGSEVQDDVSTSGDETDDEVGEVAFINSSGKTPTVTVSEAPSSSAAAPKEE